MNPVRLILIGGFLGAGKTTLLGQAGTILRNQGKRVGLITNDQAEQLVDTQLLRTYGFDVHEVSGGCFCCRFKELLSASRRLIEEHQPDVLIGEPVGSCTDLLATVLQPIQTFFSDRYHVAPFTVMVDPDRLRDLLSKDKSGPLADKVLYIYGKQLEEADFILLNKIDRLSDTERTELLSLLKDRYPHADVMGISALNNLGLEEWLKKLEDKEHANQKPLNIDYQSYAEGEALLGWLNATVRISTREERRWKPFCLDLLKGLKDSFLESKAEIAHVKLSLTAEGAALVGNLTSTRGHPFLVVQGVEEALGKEALLILNARVQIEPERLRAIVRQALESLSSDDVRAVVETLECFSPAAPVPTYRMGQAASPAGPAKLDNPDCTLDTQQICGVVRNLFKPRGRNESKPSRK